MVRQHVARFCFYFFSAKVRGKHTFLWCGAGLCSGFVLFLDAVLGSFFLLCSDTILSWFLMFMFLCHEAARCRSTPQTTGSKNFDQG
jgi:hypothetical protein